MRPGCLLPVRGRIGYPTVEDAAAICGLYSDELVLELNQALENAEQAEAAESDSAAQGTKPTNTASFL
jgi:hypothetical protein